MLLLDRQPGATTQPHEAVHRSSAPTSRFQLRVRADGRVLDLLPGKTTIGSSPRCNVRIEQPGVQPLQCLIVEAADGWRVRSWVANSTLNGEPFEESALAVGDCLRLGSVELEVFDPEAKAPAAAPVDAPAADSSNAEEIRVGLDHARVRSRQLLKALRDERSAQEQLNHQLATLQESHLHAIAEQNAVGSKLEECQAELAAAREQLAELDSHASVRQDLERQNEQLGFEIGELSAQLHELSQGHSQTAEQRQRLADEQAVLQEQLRQAYETHAHLQAELQRLVDEKAATTDQYHQLSDINARLQSDVLQLANEKAAADEQHRQLAEQLPRLQGDVGRLSNQKEDLEAEREGLRRQNDQLLSEAREIAAERSALLADQAALRQERSELRQQNESLRARVTQFNNEQSALAVSNLTLVEERDKLTREAEQLQSQVKKLSDENTVLSTSHANLAEEQARLVVEQKRLTEIEREVGAAVAGRENTAAELYRALLQISEMQQRDDQHQEVVGAYDLLRKEHDRLHDELDQFKSEISRLMDERAAVESAWQALSSEATALSESQQQLAKDNAALTSSLHEARVQLDETCHERAAWSSATEEIERERVAKQEAEAAASARLAESEQRLAELDRRLAEQAQQLAAQSSQFDAQLHQHTERSRDLAETIAALEQQLHAANESRTAFADSEAAASRQLIEAESRHGEQAAQIAELELRLAQAERRAAEAEAIAARQSTIERLEAVQQEAVWNESHSEPMVDRGKEAAREADDVSKADDVDCGGREKSSGAWDTVTAGIVADAITGAEADLPAGEVSTTPAPEVDHSNWPTPVVHEPVNEEIAVAGEEKQSEEAEGNSVIGLLWKPTAEHSENGAIEAEPAAEVEAAPPMKHEAPSFIDRYAHLLEDEAAKSEEKTTPGGNLTPAQRLAAACEEAGPKSVEPAPVKSDDDDSIEQYMAKLLQRVRGDQPTATAAAGSAATSAAGAVDPSAAESVATQPPVRQESAAPSGANAAADSTEDEAVDGLELLKRRVAASTPATDLTALRALANETARMAISRHELSKLRRNAKTKVIVATLAGLTSLWLMLDSPSWLSLQFITACGSLLVAGYWVGETVRTLLRLKRASGGSGRARVVGIETEVPGLPIDVENGERF